MAIEITVPRLGWSMDEGTFGQWLKQDRDLVREGDALFELESDKAVQEVESFDSGVLRIPPDGPQPGDSVKVGQRLGYLCQQGERAPFEVALGGEAPAHTTLENRPQAERRPGTSDRPAKSSSTVDGRSITPIQQRSVATPSARRLARELGVDVRKVIAANTEANLADNDVRASASGNGSDTKSSSPRDCAQLRVSPRAARAAAQFGVNLSDVSSSGTSGRISERDVLAAVARRRESVAAPPADVRADDAAQPKRTLDAEAIPEGKAAQPSLRQTIATRMLAAAQQTAAVTLTAAADATELVNLRLQYKAGSADRAARIPSYTDLLVKLAAAALVRHPAMLGQWADDGIVVPDGVHVAVAVDTPVGLLTPVLRDVPSLSLAEVSERLAGLISRARARRLSADELRGGTFTVTNLGGYRVDAFTPLLNLPQTAILGVGRISPQPVAVEGRVEVRDRVTLSLTFDHRVVDGATAAALLTTICELVERSLPTLLS